MKRAAHCRLCNHQEVELKKGTICGLTNEKPDFPNTCPSINFSDRLEAKIKEVNTIYENIRRRTTLTYIYTALILTISLSVMVGGWYLGKYVYATGALSTVPIIVIGIGFLLFPAAFGPLNFHRRDLKMAREGKEKLDKILSLYNMKYKIDITFGKEIHGTQEVFSDVRMERN